MGLSGFVDSCLDHYNSRNRAKAVSLLMVSLIAVGKGLTAKFHFNLESLQLP